MPTSPIHIVDAFTQRAYAGNPAAVCLLDDEADASWMEAVAAEMNLSETAFVGPRDVPTWPPSGASRRTASS